MTAVAQLAPSGMRRSRRWWFWPPLVLIVVLYLLPLAGSTMATNPNEIVRIELAVSVAVWARLDIGAAAEVYGMSEEDVFDEDKTNFVLGPIRNQRWIYSCCKQLLDRVIWALGVHEGLRFTLFRPFNWIGPKLDSLTSARIGSSRVITQLILNLVEGRPIQLIDGGQPSKSFTNLHKFKHRLFLPALRASAATGFAGDRSGRSADRR